MKSIDFFKRFERIDLLIQRKATGSPSQLAQRLNLSERQVYRVLNFMKDLGLPIRFCKSRNSYLYESDVFVQLKIKVNGQSIL